MAKRSNKSTVAIQNLLDEKRQIERWLRRLDMAGDKTPEHVRVKVKKDYGRRLEAILEELQGYRSELDASLREQRDLRDSLKQREADAEESLSEAELRHAVGEYDEEKWASIRSEITESLVGTREDLGVAQKEITALEEVLDAIDAPSPAPAEEPAPARAPEPSPRAADDDEMDEVEDLDELEGIIELEEVDVAPTEGQGGGAKHPSEAFDEMAFLKSVISGDRSVESLSSSGPRAGVGQQDSGARKGVDRSMVSSGERAGLPHKGDGVAESDTRGPTKGSTTKTVKCAECGTLNLPTEWYCENCGAELTAL